MPPAGEFPKHTDPRAGASIDDAAARGSRLRQFGVGNARSCPLRPSVYAGFGAKNGILAVLARQAI